MIKKLGIGVVVVLVVLVGVTASRPATFTVSRSIDLKAPPAIAYAHVIDFHEWAEWSPWDKLDPAMKKDYSGPPTGVGTKYSWVSTNSDVGSGSMTIVDTTPAEAIGIDLQFTSPFETKNRTDFTFKPTADGTTVTWTLQGTNDFFGKAFSLVANMDKLVGDDFVKGLADLKTHAEKHAVEAKAAEEKAAAEAAAAEAAAAAAAAAAAVVVDGGAN